MGSVNRVILVGRLGGDAEMRQTNNGTSVANFSMATEDAWTDDTGKQQSRVEWHRVVMFGRAADNVGHFLRKGREVAVEGSIQTREWTDRDGNEKRTTEIKCFRISLLGGGAAHEQAPRPAAQQRREQPFDDDAPF